MTAPGMAEPLALPPPPDGSPSGPNMEADEQDQSFGELERAAKGKPESQFGNTVEPAQPPDWSEVAAQALALLEKTRDLRVMVLLAMARVNLADMPGFASVLATIQEHLDTGWEHVHPQLDPEDDNDPLLRSNCLMLLAEPARMLRPLRDMPLARMPRGRAVSWRDIAILNGHMEAEPGRPKIGMAEVRDIFARTDQAALGALRDAVDASVAALAAVPRVFAERAGGPGPEFKDLLRGVQDIQRELARFAVEAMDPPPDEAEPEAAAEGGPAAPAKGMRAATRAATRAASIRDLGPLDTREDALLALELAAAYFRTHEPSSPLPLLIDRACRLAPMPFLEILRDLAPDGLMQAQTIAGTTPE